MTASAECGTQKQAMLTQASARWGSETPWRSTDQVTEATVVMSDPFVGDVAHCWPVTSTDSSATKMKGQREAWELLIDAQPPTVKHRSLSASSETLSLD